MSHAYQLPSGSWRIVVQTPGHRRSVTGKTKREAQTAAAQLLIDMGALRKPSAVTVGELLDEWQRGGGVKGELSSTFLADLDSLIPRLPEAFTDMPIDRVDAATVAQLYRDLRRLTRQPMSVHRVRRVHTVLHAAFAAAVTEFHWLTANPIEQVRAPAAPATSVHAPTGADVALLLDTEAGTTFGLYLEVSAVTGARRGEVVAMQWGDLVDGTVNIHRSLTETAKGGVEIRGGKTGKAGHRTIALPANVVAELAAERVRQATLSLESGLGQPVWVFSHDAGHTPWRPAYVSLRFRRLTAMMGLSQVRLHDLRHFMATQLLHAGAPISTVAHRLGHRSETTTAAIYSDYLLAADQTAADTIGRILAR